MLFKFDQNLKFLSNFAFESFANPSYSSCPWLTLQKDSQLKKDYKSIIFCQSYFSLLFQLIFIQAKIMQNTI